MKRVWSFIAWLALILLSAYLLMICNACTTIDTSKPFFAESPRAPFSGVSKEGPPSSINPTTVRLRFYADDTVHGFNLRVKRAIQRLEKHGYTITRVRPIYRTNDGIWWKRGDIHEVVIYFD